MRADPSQVAYTYAAARAAHQGAKLDRAEELYLKAIAEPGLAAELRDKSQVYLDGIATTRAEASAQEAESLPKAGKYADAADVWRSAAALQTSAALDKRVATGKARVGQVAAAAPVEKRTREIRRRLRVMLSRFCGYSSSALIDFGIKPRLFNGGRKKKGAAEVDTKGVEPAGE